MKSFYLIGNIAKLCILSWVWDFICLHREVLWNQTQIWFRFWFNKIPLCVRSYGEMYYVMLSAVGYCFDCAKKKIICWKLDASAEKNIYVWHIFFLQVPVAKWVIFHAILYISSRFHYQEAFCSDNISAIGHFST